MRAMSTPTHAREVSSFARPTFSRARRVGARTARVNDAHHNNRDTVERATHRRPASRTHRSMRLGIARSTDDDAIDASVASEDASEDAPTTRSVPRDTIAPVAEALYPRWLDAVPTFFGRLNPLTALLLFYTGAMLRESREVPIIAAQWMVFVVLPAFGAWFAARRWWYGRRAEKTGEEIMPFPRSCRSAWLDFHIGYMLLVPAGAYGGDGSSWWVMTAPALMAARWVGARRNRACRFLRRACVVVFGVAGLATLLMSASTTLVKALGALRGGGAIGLVLGPFAAAMAYVFYLAPACLLPRAVARAWTNTLDDDALPNSAAEKEDVAVKTPQELAKEKRKKRVNLLCGLAAFGATVVTGSDVPLFVLFAFQLFKVDPEELMNAVINKGSPERIEMEQKIADNFAKILPGSRGASETKKTKTNGASTESKSGDDTGAAQASV